MNVVFVKAHKMCCGKAYLTVWSHADRVTWKHDLWRCWTHQSTKVCSSVFKRTIQLVLNVVAIMRGSRTIFHGGSVSYLSLLRQVCGIFCVIWYCKLKIFFCRGGGSVVWTHPPRSMHANNLSYKKSIIRTVMVEIIKTTLVYLKH